MASFFNNRTRTNDCGQATPGQVIFTYSNGGYGQLTLTTNLTPAPAPAPAKQDNAMQEVDTCEGPQNSDLIGAAVVVGWISVALSASVDTHSTTGVAGSDLLSGIFRLGNKPRLLSTDCIRKNARSTDKLDLLLNSLKLPKASNTRDAQNYVHCPVLDGSIVDFPRTHSKNDQDQWNKSVDWIDQHSRNTHSTTHAPPDNAFDGKHGTQQLVTKVAEKQSGSSKTREEVYTVV